MSKIVVAVPARNEAEEIGGCLRALAAQRDARIDAVVICLNNCTDASAAIVRAMTPTLPFLVDPLEVSLAPGQACAGVARRIAMERAADRAGPDGLLLTIDADSRAPADWAAGNVAAVCAGAEAVAGQAYIDPAGAKQIPSHLHAADAEERDYARLLDEIDWLLDPDPVDPWPRHDEHSGASIAVTVPAYRRAGGMPPVPLGEDRAFFSALRRVDARIRHAPEVHVTVSARLVGRASGGMADTIRRRIEHMHEVIDDRLEFATAGARRAAMRARIRAAWRSRDATDATCSFFAAEFRVSKDAMRTALAAPYFGSGWSGLECASPLLRRGIVPLACLAEQRMIARSLRDTLRASQRIRVLEDRAGIAVAAIAG